MARKKKTGPPPKLARNLARQIEEKWVGPGKVGDKLPTVRQLAETFDVSQSTVLSALEILRIDSKVQSKLGSGVFVTRYQANRYVELSGKILGVSVAHAGHDIFRSYLSYIFSGLHRTLWEADVPMLINTRDYRWYSPVEPNVQFNDEKTLGIFLVEGHNEKVFRSLEELKKPMISIDQNLVKYGITSVCYDNFSGGEFLANRLYKLGHRKFGGIFEARHKPEMEQDTAWSERRDGFISACRTNNVDSLEIVDVLDRGDPDKHSAEPLKRILELPEDRRPTALFIPGSRWYETVKRYAADIGLRIPKDLSIVTCFGKDFGRKMTGMSFDGIELGTMGAQRMLAHLTGERQMVGPAELITVKGAYDAGETHAQAPRK